MKKLCILCLLLAMTTLLAACAAGPSRQALKADPASAHTVWQACLAQSASHPQAPYRLNMSLRFGKEGDTRRVTALFWGNDDHALRLDVMAGVGAVVANILEDGSHFLVYAPRENRAYFHQGSTSPLLKVGVPVPLALTDLSALLNGRYAAVFGTEEGQATQAQNGCLAFALPGRLGGVLEVDARGLPRRWLEDGHKGWVMEMDYDEAGLPRKLHLEHARGQKAIVLVKQRDAVQTPFSPAQMSLSLPESAPLLPLSRYRNPAE